MGKKFKSLGQINPFEKPIEFEYKPLGLELFGEPLAAMQANYDATEVALEDASYKINNLEPDDERSKYLVQELEADRDAILKELQRTGNARAAAKDLNRLNKFYNEDPEVLGIRTQYENLQADYKKELERAEKGELDLNDVEKKYLATVLQYSTIGGHGSREDILAGKGRAIGRMNLPQNLEDDIRKELQKLAKGAPLWSVEEYKAKATQALNKLGMESSVFQKTEYKDLDQLWGELFNAIQTSEKYRHFLESKAEINSYLGMTPSTEAVYNPYYDPNFEQNQIQRYIQDLEFKRDKAAAEGDTKTYEKFNEAINSFNTSYQRAVEKDATDLFAKGIYENNYVNDYFKDISGAFADVFDVYKTDYNFVKQGGGKGKSNVKEEFDSEALIIDSQNVSVINQSLPEEDMKISGGTSASSTDIQKEMKGMQQEFVSSIIPKPLTQEQKDSGIYDIEEEGIPASQEIIDNETDPAINPRFTIKNLGSSTLITDIDISSPEKVQELLFNRGLKDAIKNSEIIYNGLHYLNNISQISKDFKQQQNDLVAIIKEPIPSDATPNEINKLKQEKQLARAELENINYQSQAIFSSLEFKMAEAINELPDDIVSRSLRGGDGTTINLKEKLTRDFEEGKLEAVYRTLSDYAIMDLLPEYAEDIEESFGKEAIDKLASMVTTDPTYVKKSLESNLKGFKNQTNVFIENSDKILRLLKMPQDWANQVLAEGVVIPKEFLLNENLEKFSDKASTQLASELKKQAAIGTAGGVIPVQFDPVSNRAIYLPAGSYDLSFYNFESARLLGTTQDLRENKSDEKGSGGEATIFSVDLKSDKLKDKIASTGLTSKNKELLSKLLIMDPATAEEQLEDAEDVVVQAYNNLKDIPKTLQVAFRGYSEGLDLDKPLQKNTVRFLKNSISEDNAIDVSTSIQNYAKIGVALDSERTVDYNEKAITMQNLVKGNIDISRQYIVENTPSELYRYDENTGNFFGYQIRYGYDSARGEAVARVFETEFNENLDAVYVEPKLIEQIPIRDFTVPSIYYAIDLNYGVGSISNLLRDKDDRIFIPVNEAKEQFVGRLTF